MGLSWFYIQISMTSSKRQADDGHHIAWTAHKISAIIFYDNHDGIESQAYFSQEQEQIIH